MNFLKYLKDKLYMIILTSISFLIITLTLLAFKVDKSVIIAIFLILFVLFSIIFLTEYFRKKRFYTELLTNVDLLDKSYLVLETLYKPEFYEGKILYQALYEINKSMNENVNNIKNQWRDFKEYIEMWIHEVKIPLATLSLISNNHKNRVDKKMQTHIKRLEDYVDQVLYYARSENASQDYLIKEVNLNVVIKNVGIRNMDDLLENKIDFLTNNINVQILTDAKWLEFILNQLINNSIKYKRNIKNSFIKITVKEEKEKTVIVVEDNGMGIKETDLKQVFNKSFTGENGRIKSKSTGMGLFIAKNMCEKLGHKIAIESVYSKYTKVFITISKDAYYDILK